MRMVFSLVILVVLGCAQTNLATPQRPDPKIPEPYLVSRICDLDAVVKDGFVEADFDIEDVPVPESCTRELVQVYLLTPEVLTGKEVVYTHELRSTIYQIANNPDYEYGDWTALLPTILENPDILEDGQVVALGFTFTQQGIPVALALKEGENGKPILFLKVAGVASSWNSSTRFAFSSK